MSRLPLTKTIAARDAQGRLREVAIPVERALTIYLDKRELITLMTAGAQPELLALGYLRNQRIVDDISDIAAVQVDWETQACAVTLRSGRAKTPLEQADAPQIVTTGCGQGTVYARLLDDIHGVRVDPTTRVRTADLFAIAETIRQRDSLYKVAGSVHGCALFEQGHILWDTEDVGRHNAVDAISGWMWLNGISGAGKVFYTTGRLTSEMVIKCALMGIPILMSRSGATQMGYDLASELGIALFARCTNQHFLQYTAFDRLLQDSQDPQGPAR